MPVYPVFLDSWQIECCGRPVSIGDSVEWRLEFSEATGSTTSEAWYATVEAAVEPDDYGAVVRSGALVAWWSGKGRRAGSAVLGGVFHQEHHHGLPDRFPCTHGLVRRVQVLTRAYLLSPLRNEWLTIPGATCLRDVERSPKYFGGKRREPGAGFMTMDTGLLVRLEVAG